MKTERIKTNIIELNKLKKKPCEELLNMFKDGKIYAYEAFKVFGYNYNWIYQNSNYDIIGWEIENGLFNWEDFSWVVAQYCPENFDPNKYNWEDHSHYVAMYCPENLDPNKYNWKDDSWAIAKYRPEKLEPERFNWMDFSSYVARYCPDKLDPERFNWKDFSWAFFKFCPEKLDLMPEKYRKLYDENDIALNIDELEEKIKPRLFGLELKEKYGLDVVPESINRLDYIGFGNYKSIWSVSKNPKVKFPYEKENHMFVLDFSTGAFMFSYDGDEYPEKFFNQFWEELKSYKPDYEDTRSHILCWKLENAKEIFNSFDDILKKYYEMNKKRIKKERIKRLKMKATKKALKIVNKIVKYLKM